MTHPQSLLALILMRVGSPVVIMSAKDAATETKSLIDGDVPAESHAESGIPAKLAALGQPGIEPVLGRNLEALLEKR